MRTLLALFGVFLMLAVCAVGSWGAIRPPLALLVVPGATDIQVARRGWNAWQMSYHAPAVPTTWSSAVVQQLEAQHWASPDQVGYGALSRSYSREVSFGVGELWEWTYLTVDPLRPQLAQILVRRWIAFPWWRRLSAYISPTIGPNRP
jgi:hypothetical protein